VTYPLNLYNKKKNQSSIKRGIDTNSFVKYQDLVLSLSDFKEDLILDFNNIVYIAEDLSNLNTPINNTIFLDADKTYIVTTHIDLMGNRLETTGVCNLFGTSSETASITSTGLGVGVPLINSEYTIVLESLTIKNVDTAIAIDGSTNLVALDWRNVIFENVSNVGVINTCDNFILDTGAFLGAQGLKFTGTIGTVGMNNSLFRGLGSSGNIIELDANCIITRRFRIIYSSVVAFGTTIGIDVNASATIPVEAYILDTVNFSGGSTYLVGVDHTSTKALFINCVGITNVRSIGAMYMKNNAIETVIPNVNDRVPMAGVTQVNGINQRFSHDLANNALEYTGILSQTFHITATFTIAPASNNQKYGIYLGVNRGGAIDPNADRISESEVYINTPQSGRADAAAVQALVTLNEGDKVYMILQNVTSSANVTVEFLNMIIK
jgi:hypothetical protein